MCHTEQRCVYASSRCPAGVVLSFICPHTLLCLVLLQLFITITGVFFSSWLGRCVGSGASRHLGCGNGSIGSSNSSMRLPGTGTPRFPWAVLRHIPPRPLPSPALRYTCSWTLSLGEFFIKRLPLVKHIYSASKQVSGALNPDSNEGSKAFQECVLARHPRHGEYAIAFITGRTVLQVGGWVRQRTAGVAWALLATTPDLLRSVCMPEGCVSTCGLVVLLLLQTHEGDMRLVSVYVPTNHVYVGECACCQAQRRSAVRYASLTGVCA